MDFTLRAIASLVSNVDTFKRSGKVVGCLPALALVDDAKVVVVKTD